MIPTLLLGAALVVPGCVYPKTIGQETEGGSGEGTDTQGETDGASGESGGPCSPIDIAECMECECIDDDWSCSNANCVYDCEGQACGDACMMCPEGDPECTSPEFEGVCTADGQCVGVPPPELGFCVGALEPGFEAELTQSGGCADMWVYAFDATDARGVALSIGDALVADMVASGMPLHAEYAVTDAVVDLEARAGILVTDAECNDAPSLGAQIDETWLPTAGAVIVDIVPVPGDPSVGLATVELVDVVFARTQPGPAPITVPSLVIADVLVGWLPG